MFQLISGLMTLLPHRYKLEERGEQGALVVGLAAICYSVIQPVLKSAPS